MFSTKTIVAALSVLSFTTSTLALPTQYTNTTAVEARDSDFGPVTITLIDATQHEWPITVPSTQTWTPTGVSESISHVRIQNTGYVPCEFFGVDNTVIISMPGETKDMDVGPPQTIVGGICGPCKRE